MNPEFEEWVNEFVHGEEEMDVEFLVREAYKLRLNRGFEAGLDGGCNPENDGVLLQEVNKELEVLNSDEVA